MAAIPPAGSKPNPKRQVEQQPEESKYPLNTVYTTTGGHVITIGNERGKEAISIVHAKGTNIQIYPDGMISIYTPGEYRQHSKSATISTDKGNYDIHVNGYENKTVSGGMMVQVVGDANMVVGGSVTMLTPQGDFNVRSKNMLFTASDNVNFNVGGNFMADIKGTSTIMSDGAAAVLTNASLDLKGGGRTAIKGSEIHHNNGSDQAASGQIAANRLNQSPV